jgi:hypothetical protein
VSSPIKFVIDRLSIVYLLSGLATVAVVLYRYDPKEPYDAILAATISLILIFVFDRVIVGDKYDKLAAKFETLSQETLSRIVENSIKNTGIYQFRSMAEAVEYISSNARNAIQIYNTRLEPVRYAEQTVRGLFDQRIEYDEAVVEAFLNGCEVYYICVPHLWSTIETLKSKCLAGMQSKNRHGGGFTSYKLDNKDDIPLLQMVLVRYRNGTEEALVGWDSGYLPNSNSQVILVRNHAVTSFLLDYYKELVSKCDMSNRVIIER